MTAALVLLSCADPRSDFDSLPIPLVQGAAGELQARFETEAGPALGIVDPGSPITMWHRPGEARLVRRDIRVVGPPHGPSPAPLRAHFQDHLVVETELGTTASGLRPSAILGADLMAGLTVEIGFAGPEMVLWRKQVATDGFLSANGYAVLRVPRRGGGRLDLEGPRNWLGQRAEFEIPASRLIMRGCAAPLAARAALPRTCNNLRDDATGVDVSLLFATGIGPMVIGRAAWERIRAVLPGAPAVEERMLTLPTAPAPIPATFTAIPRLALVNREVDLVGDPGPCAELGRARRLEVVSRQQVDGLLACPCPCDRAGGDERIAENSSGYLELEGDIEVAVISDTTPWLQALRADVRPQGPELDGVIGARALGRTRVEIDYFSGDLRAIFSCEPDGTASGLPANPAAGLAHQTLPAATAPKCETVGRCPRLPDATQKHFCFGLPEHGLPESCNNGDSCKSP